MQMWHRPSRNKGQTIR
ncbi:hypothetical protein ACHAXN_007629 [Cyclotella atomus]